MGHSSKILGRAGISLADVYDVEGSQAGLEELDSSEVKTVHEMGSTIFAERASGFVTRVSSGAIAQSLNFDTILLLVGDGISRILGVVVTSEVAARLTSVQVSIRNTSSGVPSDFPIFSWETGVGGDVEKALRLAIVGGAAANRILYEPGAGHRGPTMMFGGTQRSNTPTIALRGTTPAFGAGTIQVDALIYSVAPVTQSVSSVGLPIPSW